MEGPATIAKAIVESSSQKRSFERVRLVLLLAFGSLLVIVAAVSVYSFHTLRQLQTVEDQVRHRLLARNQSLLMISESLHVYNDDMERFLVDDRQASIDQVVAALASDVSEIRSELREYPSDRQPEETSWLAQIDQDCSDEQRAFTPSLSWTVEERRKRGPALIREQIIPRRQEILRISRAIAAWNDHLLAGEDRELLSRFRHSFSKLAWTLTLTLLLGVVLSCTSTLYILQLQSLERSRYQELTEHRQQLQELSSRLVDAQEEERRSISRELHDEVGQSLEALLVETGRLSKLVPKENTVVQEQVTRIKSVLETAVNSIRNISLLLRPSMLDDLGLTSALEWQAREMSRRGDMEVDIYSDNVSDELDDERKICVYRLAQEALNNAARHASATNAKVSVVQTSDRITIEVVDNGKGFDAQHVRGMGLLGMEERIRRLGGTITIASGPGSGTSIKAEVPVSSDPKRNP